MRLVLVFNLWFISTFFFPIWATCEVSEANKSLPKRLVILVFDQMRPDYIDRFHLPNFQRLRRLGTEHTNAYVGHLGALTIVSHPVLTTGLLPRDLPWQDEVFLDRHNILGKQGAAYNPMKLSVDQLNLLLAGVPQKFNLAALIQEKIGKNVFSIGQKNYAAASFGGGAAHSIITLNKNEGKCLPVGKNVPDDILLNNRFVLPCADDLGTDKGFYHLDGAHYVPGEDKNHQGGDVWTTDVVLSVMKYQDWGGIFATFGGIDKIGHLTGDFEKAEDHPFLSPISFRATVELADRQLGRILDELTARNLLDETLLVVTSDHGAQRSDIYLGAGGDFSFKEWVVEEGTSLPFWVKRIRDLLSPRSIAGDTSLRLWFDQPRPSNELIKGVLGEMSGVLEVWVKDKKDKYSRLLAFNERAPVNELKWGQQHNEELLQTIEGPDAPDVYCFLRNGVGLSLLGDHGGAQEKVQRIPMFIIQPRGKKAIDPQPIRLVGLNKRIREMLGY